MSDRTCDLPGCSRPYKALGMCGLHYQRHRDGRPLDLQPQRADYREMLDLIAHGVDPLDAARRVGVNVEAASKQMYRIGRVDLARVYNREVKRQRSRRAAA